MLYSSDLEKAGSTTPSSHVYVLNEERMEKGCNFKVSAISCLLRDKRLSLSLRPKVFWEATPVGTDPLWEGDI